MGTRHRSRALTGVPRFVVIGALLLMLMTPAIQPARAQDDLLTATPTQEVTQQPTEDITDPTQTPEPVTSTPTAETPPTETATVEPTPTATDLPTAVPTEVSSQTAPVEESPVTTATETATASQPTAVATATEKPVAPSATNGRLVIKVVDQNGKPLGGSCFQVHTPAGMWRAADCDSNNDGLYNTISLAPGDYVLIQGAVASGYGPARDKSFTIAADRTRTITVTNLPLSKLVLSVVDATTNAPLAGGCFRLTPQLEWPYNESIYACDDSDGTSDGTVTFQGLLALQYLLVEGSSKGLAGYIHPVDQLVNISKLNTTFNLTIPFQFGASLEIVNEDEIGNPLTGACFRLYTDAGGGALGDWVATDCAYGATPDRVTFTTLPTGDYVIYQLYPPINYIRAADQLIHLTAGEASSVTVVNTIGGTILVHTFDQNSVRLSWMCYQLFKDDNGSPGELIETQCGNYEHPQEATFTSLPTGSYILVEPNPPHGLLKVANQTIAVTAGVTTTIDVTHTIGAQVLLHLVDEDAIPLLGACFDVQGIQGTEYWSSFCDSVSGNPDGDTLVTGLFPGTYSFSEYMVPQNHSNAENFIVTVTGPDQIQEVTAVNISFGMIEIHTLNPNQEPLKSMCFQAYKDVGEGVRGEQVGQACDDWSDQVEGLATLWLPPGKYVIGQEWSRDEFTTIDDVTAEVTSKQTTLLDITVPTASIAVIHTVDIVSNVPLGLACYRIFLADDQGNPVGEALTEQCDWSDYSNDGTTTIGGLKHGMYVIVQTNRPTGYPVTPPLAFSIGVMETKEITFANKGYPPKVTSGPWLTSLTTTGVNIIWETDQKTVGSVQYGPTDTLGKTSPSTPGPAAIRNNVKLTGLLPGKRYYIQIHSSNANGDVSSIVYWFTTVSEDESARVVIKKVNNDGVLLPGSCFDVYADAGAGDLGSYWGGACDKWDTSPDDGKMIISGLKAGAYVLVEHSAPAGYLVSKNRPFTIAAGQTLRITVKDAAGGLRLKVTTTDDTGAVVLDACYIVYQKLSGNVVGNEVAWNCDDYDGLDGKTTIVGLDVGSYYLFEHYTPDGYLRGDMASFTVKAGATSRSMTVVNHRAVAPDVILLRAVDSEGHLFAGACFSLYGTPGDGVIGGYIKSTCDYSDGHNDGLTYFTDFGSQKVIAIEYIAPEGYQAGAKVTISKSGSKMKIVDVLQTAGHLNIKITTKKGDSSTALTGVCYALERLVKGRWELVTLSCDSWDGLDGLTVLTGVPAGTYRIIQYNLPKGYGAVDPISITITTRSKSITVRSYPI